jgi:hypothetical protein
MPTKEEEIESVKKFLEDNDKAEGIIAKTHVVKGLFTYLLSSTHLLSKENMKFVNTVKAKIDEFKHKEQEVLNIIGDVMNQLSVKIRPILLSVRVTENKAIIDTIREGDLPGVLQYVHDNPENLNKSLYTNGHVTDAQTETLLGMACFYNHEDIIRALLDAGAKPDVYTGDYTYPVIKYVMDNKAYDIIRLLLDRGYEINYYQSGNPLLFIAAEMGDLTSFKLFIERGASVNFKRHDNTTIFDVVLKEYYKRKEELPYIERLKEIIEYILNETDIDKNIRMKGGVLPLYFIQKNKLDDLAPLFTGFPDPSDQTKPLDVRDVDIPDSVDSSNVPVSRYEMEMADGIPVMTIPRGTLLYNSYTIKEADIPTLEYTMKLMPGLLPFGTNISVSDTGGITIRGCIDKLQQKFFYSNPAGGPALGSVTKGAFNIMGVFEATRDMRFAVLMTPGKYHRLSGEHPSKMPCDQLDMSSCRCSAYNPMDGYTTGEFSEGKYKGWSSSTIGGRKKKVSRPRCKYGHYYDVCLTPEFLHEHRLDGHIALAGEDSYEMRMKPYDEKFLNTLEFDVEYRKLNRSLFDSGSSADIRPPDDEHNTIMHINGFPELVIHMFGTEWYDKKESIEFTYNIPMPVGHTQEDCVAALMKLLVDLNNGVGPDLGFTSPLKSIGISTTKKWRNLLNGTEEGRKYDAAEHIINNFYINILDSFVRGDMRFYFDIRNGFLIREGSASPNLNMEDGRVLSFKNVSTRGTDVTAFESSSDIRAEGGIWWAKDCLMPFIDTTGWYEWNNNNEVGEAVISDTKTRTSTNENENDNNNSSQVSHNGGAALARRRKRGTVKKGYTIRINTLKKGMDKSRELFGRKKMKYMTVKVNSKVGKNMKRNVTRRSNTAINALVQGIKGVNLNGRADMKREDDFDKKDFSGFVLPNAVEEAADKLMEVVRAKMGV